MLFYCYILRSLEKEKSIRNYIGFTTNPKRRIRQHNGELKCGGARRTSAHRPWTFVVVISGFPNKIVALQFEWQLQHHAESRILRGESGGLTHPKGWKGKLSILASMLNTRLWKQLNLTLNFVDGEAYEWFCQSRRDVVPNELVLTDLETFAVATPDKGKSNDDQSTPPLCEECGVSGGLQWRCRNCRNSQHLSCTARRSLFGACSTALIPTMGSCLVCNMAFAWIDIVRTSSPGDDCVDMESDVDELSQRSTA